jgi:hypothetical protein
VPGRLVYVCFTCSLLHGRLLLGTTALSSSVSLQRPHPTMSMHSIREMCGTDDVETAYAHFRAFFETFTATDRSVLKS